LPGLGLVSRVDVSALSNGRWLLVVQWGTKRLWTAWQLAVTPSGIRWEGATSGTGALLGAPIDSRDGVQLPTADKAGRLQLLPLDRARFVGNASCGTL
jgi:hypothetical protein